MELDKFIKQDILDFLNRTEEEDIAIKGVKPDEMSLFDIDKNYLKELQEQLTANNLNSAKDVFDELRTAFNRTSMTDPNKKKIFLILKSLYEEIQAYIQKHELKNITATQLQHYKREKIFDATQVPQRVLEEHEAPPDPKKDSADESFNLLRSDIFKKAGDGKKDISKLMAKEISQSIPLEESTELSSILGQPHERIVEVDKQPIYIQQTTPAKQVQPTIIQTPAIEGQANVEQAPSVVQTSQAPTQSIQPPQIIQSSVPSSMNVHTTTDINPESIKSMVAQIAKEFLTKDHQDIDLDKAAENELLVEKRKEQLQENLKLKKEREVEKKLHELILKHHKELTQKKQEELKRLQEEKKKLEEERQDLRNKNKEIEKKLASFRNIHASHTSTHNILEEKKREIGLLDQITMTRKKIHAYLLNEDTTNAKIEYKKIKELFLHITDRDIKSKMYKELIDVYNQIKFIEQQDKVRRPHKVSTIEIMGKVKDNLTNAKKHILRSQYQPAESELKTASALVMTLPDEKLRNRALEIISHYRARIQDFSKEPAPSNINKLYMKGVSLLYEKKKDEARAIFQQVLMQDPNNVAAKLRLKQIAR